MYRVSFNLLKPTGHVIHQQFNIQQLYCPHCIYVFCIYLRTSSDLCHLQHKLFGFYNLGEKCLQRGMDWVFKSLNSELNPIWHLLALVESHHILHFSSLRVKKISLTFAFKVLIA